MAQYCRYCQHFVTGNGNWCEAKEISPSFEYSMRTNKCKEFELNPIDAYGINENGYQPRKPKRNDGKQLKMEL